MLGKSKESEEAEEEEPPAHNVDNAGDGDVAEDGEWGEGDEGKSGWWDEEDSDAPWMTQSTKLMPNTTVALWQFTP